MALERLLASLEHEATAQADALLAQARAAATRVAAASAERAAVRKRETLDARERAQRMHAELALARARRAARARVLEARARLLARVFAAAGDALAAAARSAAFTEALGQRLAAARVCLGEGDVVVRCAPALVEPIRQLVRGQREIAVRADAAVATGFVMATGDGAIAVDETLATRLSRRQQELALAVMAALDVRAS